MSLCAKCCTITSVAEAMGMAAEKLNMRTMPPPSGKARRVNLRGIDDRWQWMARRKG